MKKTIIKIYARFTMLAMLTAIILLVLNFLVFAVVLSDTNKLYDTVPKAMLEQISESYIERNEPEMPDGVWAILIAPDGNVIWDKNMPEDIPLYYSINDVAAMTKWFLNDYPVYVRAEDCGLFVLGYPKNAVGKYDMEYSMSWFEALPQKALAVLTANVLIAMLLACAFGTGVYKSIKTVVTGISGLRDEKDVRLKEKGLFKVISRSINKTSQKMQYKNAVIAQRDNARSNWIAGVSHDIRTPLSVISGYSEELAESRNINNEEKNKLCIITAQTMKIKKLVDDLNLISSLEYDMQPSKMVPVNICSMLRRITADIMNSTENADIRLELDDGRAVVMGDEHLLERAVFNIMNNSVIHNEKSTVTVCEHIVKSDNTVVITIHDNGKGVKDEVLENITRIPKTAHGLGLPVAYRIITAHGGSFEAYNDNGFCVKITLAGVDK